MKRDYLDGALIVAACHVAVACGCHAPAMGPEDVLRHRQESLTCLKMACSTSQDPAVRARAIRELGDADSDALPWIQQGLYDPAPQVRIASSLALASRGTRESAANLESLLEDRDVVVRGAAMLGLTRGGAQSYRAELERLVLQSDDLRLSETAVPLLIELSDLATKDDVEQWLRSAADAAPLQYAATCGLLKKADKEMTRQIIVQAQTGTPRQQRSAIEMLAFAVDPAVIYVLLDRLDNGADLAGRLAAARSLGEFESPAGADLALRYLQYEPAEPAGPEAVARAVDIRALACEVCGVLGSREALQSLSELLQMERDPAVRVACAAAIARLTAPEVGVMQ